MATKKLTKAKRKPKYTPPSDFAWYLSAICIGSAGILAWFGDLEAALIAATGAYFFLAVGVKFKGF